MTPFSVTKEYFQHLKTGQASLNVSYDFIGCLYFTFDLLVLGMTSLFFALEFEKQDYVFYISRLRERLVYKHFVTIEMLKNERNDRRRVSSIRKNVKYIFQTRHDNLPEKD